MAMVNRQHGVNSLQTLRSLLTSFAKIDAPKTVVWISEGLALAEDRVEIGGMAAMAAAARTTIYSLHLDQTIIADASRSRPSPSMMQDRQLATDGLAMIAGITRGSMFTSIGTGTNVFQRIAKEMTAYYLLSAEPAAAGSRWPAAPHQGRRQSQRRQHPRASRVHAGQGRAGASVARSASGCRPAAATAGYGVADQGGHLQPAHAGCVHRQGGGDDRIWPQCHHCGGRRGGVHRADRQRQESPGRR